MIRFINLWKSPSGTFNISLFGIDLFTKSKRFAITILNIRILFCRKEK